MLEDRLSHTYSQHAIGDYRKNVPQSSNMYPPIPSELPRGQGGAESYYSINGTSHIDSYAHARPQTEQNIYLPPQSPYTRHDRIPPTPSSHYIATPAKNQQGAYQIETQAQLAPSFQSYPQSPASGHDVTFLSNQYQSYQQRREPAGQPQSQASSTHSAQTPATYSTDPTASFHGITHDPDPLRQQPQQFQQGPQASERTYVASPEQSQQGPIRQEQPPPSIHQFSGGQKMGQPPQLQHIYSPIPQDFDTPYERSLIEALRTSEGWNEIREAEYFEGKRRSKREIEFHRGVQAREARAPQWQQQLPQTQQESTLPQHPQIDTQPSLSYPSMTSYTQASFPPAPQHRPLPKPVEESLIEL